MVLTHLFLNFRNSSLYSLLQVEFCPPFQLHILICGTWSNFLYAMITYQLAMQCMRQDILLMLFLNTLQNLLKRLRELRRFHQLALTQFLSTMVLILFQQLTCKVIVYIVLFSMFDANPILKANEWDRSVSYSESQSGFLYKFLVQMHSCLVHLCMWNGSHALRPKDGVMACTLSQGVCVQMDNVMLQSLSSTVSFAPATCFQSSVGMWTEHGSQAMFLSDLNTSLLIIF